MLKAYPTLKTGQADKIFKSLLILREEIKSQIGDELYNEIVNSLEYVELKFANENITTLCDPTITGGQLSMAIDTVRVKAISETFEDLVEDGLINVEGINKDGDFLYSLNTDSDEFSKKRKKSSCENVGKMILEGKGKSCWTIHFFVITHL